MTNSPKLLVGSISDVLRATNHAGITVRNCDCESGLPKCLPSPLPGDPRSNFHRLILLCHSNPVRVPVSPLETALPLPFKSEKKKELFKNNMKPTAMAKTLLALMAIAIFRMRACLPPLSRSSRHVHAYYTARVHAACNTAACTSSPASSATTLR